MERRLESLFPAVVACLSFAVACSPPANSNSNNGPCGTVTCPVGCGISADCLHCVPEVDAGEGVGTTCSQNSDCCTGYCDPTSSLCALSPDAGAPGITTDGGVNPAGDGGPTVADAGCSGDVPVEGPCTQSCDCSSDWCPKPQDGGTSVCACNAPDKGYACKVPSDCCAGGICNDGGVCVSAPTKSCKPSNPPTPANDAQCGDVTQMVCGSSGTCIPNCHVGSCATGQICDMEGHCVSAVSTSGGATSSGGSSTSSSSGGGSSTSGSASSSSGGSSTSSSSGGTSGSCAALDQSEFGGCADAGTTVCGSGLTCTNDPAFGSWACEYTCSKTTDCPDLGTVCVNQACTLNACGAGTAPDGGSVNGSYDNLCNAAATNDGTCMPVVDPDAGFLGFGICVQGGSSATTCSASASTRCAAGASGSNLCKAGLLCSSPSATCVQMCDPNGGTCPGGVTCSAQNQYVGICPSSSSSSSSGGSSTSSSGGSSTSSSGGSSTSSSGGSSTSSSGGTSGSIVCQGCTPGQHDCGANGVCITDNNYYTGCGTACSSHTTCPSGSTCQDFVNYDSQTGSTSDAGTWCFPASDVCSGGSSGSSGSSGAGCGQVGDQCSTGSDCCNNYCRGGVCHCNKGGGKYPCQSQSDCCSGVTCSNGYCN